MNAEPVTKKVAQLWRDAGLVDHFMQTFAFSGKTTAAHGVDERGPALRLNEEN